MFEDFDLLQVVIVSSANIGRFNERQKAVAVNRGKAVASRGETKKPGRNCFNC